MIDGRAADRRKMVAEDRVSNLVGDVMTGDQSNTGFEGLPKQATRTHSCLAPVDYTSRNGRRGPC